MCSTTDTMVVMSSHHASPNETYFALNYIYECHQIKFHPWPVALCPRDISSLNERPVTRSISLSCNWMKTVPFIKHTCKEGRVSSILWHVLRQSTIWKGMCCAWKESIFYTSNSLMKHPVSGSSVGTRVSMLRRLTINTIGNIFIQKIVSKVYCQLLINCFDENREKSKSSWLHIA